MSAKLTKLTQNSNYKKAKSLISSIFLLLFSLFGIGIIILWIFQKLKMPNEIAGTLASQLSLLIYGLYLFNFDFKEIKSVLNKKKDFSAFWWGVRVTILVLLTNVLLGVIFNQGGEVPDSTQEVLDKSSFLLTFFFPVIVAPIVEELTFRAGLKHALVSLGTWNELAYVIVSSVIFGLLHGRPGTSLLSIHVILTTVMGIIYSTIYIKRDNIYTPIISHMIYNGLVVTLASMV